MLDSVVESIQAVCRTGFGDGSSNMIPIVHILQIDIEMIMNRACSVCRVLKSISIM